MGKNIGYAENRNDTDRQKSIQHHYGPDGLGKGRIKTMKKFVSLLLAVFLIIGAAASSTAETEASGTADMPLMGMSIVLPEEIPNAKGQIVTDGVFPFVDGVIYYAYWTYCAMTEE